MKTRFITLAAIAAMLCSCSYEQVVVNKNTVLHFTIEECKGTQAVISVKPQDDRVYFNFGIMKSAFLDSLEAEGRSMEYLEMVVEESREEYNDFVRREKESGAHYIASYSDYYLYYAHARERYTGLDPETDYYAVGYCASSDGTPLGPYQTLRFTTTAVDPTPSGMELQFMIHDNDKGSLCYYVKPLLDGKICRDFYLADIVSDEDLAEEPFKGDINKYAFWVYSNLKEVGVLSDMLRTDITRTDISDLRSLGEGKGYTVFGAPFNINNAKNVYSYHFEFKYGMHVDYTNDNQL